MVSKSKLYAQLDRMEADLRQGIVPHLERAAAGENDLVFCVTEFNVSRELRSKADRRTEDLVQLGRGILALREKLGESSDGTIAERICWYCRKWVDIQGDQEKAAQILAKAFVEEILDGKSRVS